LVLEEHLQHLVLPVRALIVIAVLHLLSQQFLLLVAGVALHTLQVCRPLLQAVLVEVAAVLEETLHLRLILCLVQLALLVKVLQVVLIQVLDKVKAEHLLAVAVVLEVLVEME
jgi:hypothetical protein